MPIDYSDPKVIRFRTENEEKADKLRLRWFIRKSEELKALATFKDTYKGNYPEDVITSSLNLFIPALVQHNKSTYRNRCKKPVVDVDLIAGTKLIKTGTLLSLGLAKPYEENATKDLIDVPKMRPVDPKATELIYKGLPYYGRMCYLKTRTKTKPEKKYYFPECSSYDYGWRMKDSAMPMGAPAYPRNYTYHKSSRSRTGPHPDPNYYKQANQSDYNKCSI